MDPHTDSTLYVDHHGGLHRRPSHVSAMPRQGIHAVLRHAGRLLLVNPPDADWLELPGGGIESGEDPATALSRELHEEAGLQLPPTALTPTRESRLRSRYYASTRRAFWDYAQCFWLIDLAQRPAGGEPLEAGHRRAWIAADELHRHSLHHVHRIGLDRLLGIHA